MFGKSFVGFAVYPKKLLRSGVGKQVDGVYTTNTVFKVHLSSWGFAGYFSVFCLFLVGVGWGMRAFLSESFAVVNEDGVEKRIAILAEAIYNVQTYEHQLKMRSNVIGQLIETAASQTNLYYDNSAVRKKRGLAKGVGGGDFFDISALSTINSGESGQHQPIEFGKGRRLLESLDRYVDLLDQVPLGSPADGEISSTYGWRVSPFAKFSQLHSGIDMAIDEYAPVVATADGVVSKAEYIGAYGLAVLVDHLNGMQTLYGHLSGVTVEQGQDICRGQQVGFLGSTGRSTGPHVHYEVRIDGVPKNPRFFIEIPKILHLLSQAAH